jgi:hypothetical protein
VALNTILPLPLSLSLQHKMWSALQIILIIIFGGNVLVLLGAFGYAIGYAILRSETPHQTESPVLFAHPVPLPTIDIEEIELSDLPDAPHDVQLHLQSAHSCLSPTIDLEEMGISINDVPEFPPARSSSVTLDGATFLDLSRLEVEI